MPEQRLKVLVLTDFRGNTANVVRDYLYCFNHFSRHEFSYLHAWRSNHCRRLRQFDFDRYDVILFFWDCYWVAYNDPTSPFYVPPWLRECVAATQALKVQFLQDEYRDVRTINGIMADLGVNLVFTCVAEQDHDLFYPRSLIPSLEGAYTVLTGYVPAYLERIDYPAQMPRPVDIGYRSRAVPFYLGSLGQEKTQIAEEFTHIGRQYGFSTDISVREEDRIYGERWLEFLQSSRFSLGTESGASVIDLDGQIRMRTEQYLDANPHATFEEVKRRFFADVDGKAAIQTISPRIFEAAAFHNTLVLHEGAYAGIVQPDVHFIAVKKDYSNVEEVVAKMRDQTLCQRLAERTHEDLIRSRRYNYRSFVRHFDAILSRHRQPSPRADGSRLLFYAANYWHEGCIIPRAGQFVVLPHPRDLVKPIESMGMLTSLASIDPILALLSSCDPLRRRVLEVLGHPGECANFSWPGLARDLRILAILSFALHRQAGGDSAFNVDVEYDPGRKRLNFRSIPCAGAEYALPAGQAIIARLGREDVASIAWDHGQVGDRFTLPGGPSFSIYINAARTYCFKDLHAIFAKHADQEMAALAQLLGKPPARSRLRHALTLTQLCGALAVGMLGRKPLAVLKKLLARKAKATSPAPADEPLRPAA